MNYAPIGIVTYSRIDHLTKTIDSLKLNDLAQESKLYIFLDAPRLGDEKKVEIVRDYLYTISGFKKVIIIERKTNDLYANFILGISQLFEEYGRCIFMEDDNIVSSNFLKYMNDGLEFYKNDKNIFAINGFNVPSDYPDSYKYDYYVSSFFSAWGYALWADRNLLDILSDNNQYNEMLLDKDLYKKVKAVNPGLIPGLKLIQEGKLNAGDYKIEFYMIKNNLYTVKPIKSIVNNIGNDGSGVHCISSNKFDNMLPCNRNIRFKKDVKYRKDIDVIWRIFMDKKPSLLTRINNKIRRYLNVKIFNQ